METSAENPVEETLMTVDDVAKYLKFDKQTVYRKIGLEELPFIRIDKSIRFRKEDIDKWLSKQAKGVKQ